MSPLTSRVRRVAAGVIQLSRPGITSIDHGCESGIGNDERGQQAGPPVHAVRARDVLELDGLRAPPVICAHA